MTKGSRNLILLGVFSILIALLTSGVSLALYHSSGDIYLDRSRPGFLPEEDDDDDKKEEEYHFSDSGALDASSLKEYLTHFDEKVKTLDSISDPFSEKPLSSDSLGIPKE